MGILRALIPSYLYLKKGDTIKQYSFCFIFDAFEVQEQPAEIFYKKDCF